MLLCTPMLFASMHKDHANGVLLMKAAEPDTSTQTERLADQIASLVLSGDFEPGLRLDEHMLAERFGVSRTPVREALRQLASTGLIEIKPRRGATVASATSAQLDHLFGAMAEIEATCSRLAAMSMTPIERRRLQSLHESMAELVGRNDRDGFAAANLTFHTLIYTGAHNDIITEFATGRGGGWALFRRAHSPPEAPLPRSQE